MSMRTTNINARNECQCAQWTMLAMNNARNELCTLWMSLWANNVDLRDEYRCAQWKWIRAKSVNARNEQCSPWAMLAMNYARYECQFEQIMAIRSMNVDVPTLRERTTAKARRRFDPPLRISCFDSCFNSSCHIRSRLDLGQAWCSGFIHRIDNNNNKNNNSNDDNDNNTKKATIQTLF